MNLPENLDNLSSEELFALVTSMQNLALAKKRAEDEAERKRLEQLPIFITVKSFTYNQYKKSGYIGFVLSKRRDDVVNYLHSIPGWQFQGELHTLAWPNWESFVKWCALPENNISEIRITESVQKLINEYLNDPDYYVDLDSDKKLITVKWNIKVYPFSALASIPGNKVDNVTRIYKYRQVEGWRLYQNLTAHAEKYPEVTIKYSDSALAFLEYELKRHIELIKCSELEEYPPYMNIDMNGVKPKDYQSVGARFAILSGGRCLIADPTGLGKSLQALLFVKLRMMGEK